MSLAMVPCRMLVGRKGGLLYVHERDPSWDVNDYLIELKAELKTWREVYWRLWGTVNYQTCSRFVKYRLWFLSIV